jgi:hypothetical protein
MRYLREAGTCHRFYHGALLVVVPTTTYRPVVQNVELGARGGDRDLLYAEPASRQLFPWPSRRDVNGTLDCPSP